MSDRSFLPKTWYQITAFSPTDELRWALRSDLAPPAYPVELIDDRVAGIDRADSRNDLKWDEILPAIEIVRVDGRGRIWVYPTDTRRTTNEEGRLVSLDEKPVDVYSSDGDLLYSGVTDNIRWSAAHGDFVYTLRVDPVNEEQVVARYRITGLPAQ